MSCELKPCPRCGDEMHIMREWIECEGCYLTYGYDPSRKKTYDDVENLIKQWNMEFPPEPLSEPEPVTLEQLYTMDGKAVWLTSEKGADGVDALVICQQEAVHAAYGTSWYFEDYGKTWLAYTHKPTRRGEE